MQTKVSDSASILQILSLQIRSSPFYRKKTKQNLEESAAFSVVSNILSIFPDETVSKIWPVHQKPPKPPQTLKAIF